MRYAIVSKFRGKKTILEKYNTKRQAQKEIDNRRGLLYTIDISPKVYSVERIKR
jgi:hypothetical protein